MKILGGFNLKISKEQVEHVAHLARLNLTEEEKIQMTKDMEAIIEFADQINELDISDVEPTAHVIPINNVFREDVVRPSMDRDELLSNAPNKEDGCFSVPKIVE
jgi:aspartyl-tRNA(Asn)/glutamyl-tRNA(Gln) amidotransferase subunit C